MSVKKIFVLLTLFFVSDQMHCEVITATTNDSFAARLGKIHIPEFFALKEIVFGDPNAPVELIIYFSYTCAYCRTFHQKEFPNFKKKYVDTGKVKIVFRNYLDDQGALDAAQIIRCLCKDSSEKYLELSEKVLNKQIEWKKSSTPQQFLVKIFVDARFDQQNVHECLKRTDVSAGLMLEQKRAIHKYDLNTMPVFICENRIRIGSTTCEELKDLCKLKELITSPTNHKESKKTTPKINKVKESKKAKTKTETAA